MHEKIIKMENVHNLGPVNIYIDPEIYNAAEYCYKNRQLGSLLSELPLQLLFPSKQLTELNMNKQGM
jgi:hypothetical protein